MPDSLSCDYNTDPVRFFKNILSSKDRFSYCTHNPSYSGSVECLNLGFANQLYSDGEGQDELLQILYVSSLYLKKSGLKRGDWLKLKGRIGNAYYFEKGKINGVFFAYSRAENRPRRFVRKHCACLQHLSD